MKFKWVVIPVVIFFTVSSVVSQADINADKSVKQSRISSFIEAFNSDSGKVMVDYIAQNFTETSLKALPPEARLPFIEKMHDEIQTASVRRLVRITETAARAVVRSNAGRWYNFDFEFEPQPPFKLVAVSIQSADGPEEGLDQPKAQQPQISTEEMVSQIGNLLDNLAKADEFSGVVLVAAKDKPVFVKAYGLASQEAKILNNVETKFNIGSIDKVFTRIAIGQLVALGKLTYDDKLIKWLPDYPNKGAAEKITVRELLNHTSGVGDIFGPEYQNTPKERLRNIDDFIPLFSKKPLAFEPGTKEQYSNGGYVLLGAIIERVSHESYYDYVDKNIFGPLKMSGTAFYESDKAVPNLAEGYTTLRVDPASGKKRQNNSFSRPARASSAGGGYSTASDLLKFSLALQSGKIVIPRDDENGKTAPSKMSDFGIAGGSPGVNAALEILPDKGYTIIVLSNYDPQSATAPAEKILSLVRRLNN